MISRDSILGKWLDPQAPWPVPLGIVVLFILIAAAWFFLPHPLLMLVLGLIPFALLLVIKEAFLMVLLFVIFSFFRIHEVIPQLYNFKIPLMLSAASLITLFWHLVISQNIKLYWTKSLGLLSLFTLLVIVGLVLAANRPVAITYFMEIYWKIILMTFAVAYLTRTANDFNRANHLIAGAGILVACVAIYNKINEIGLVEGTRVTIGRDIGSMLGDPNDLALVLMFPASFSLSLIMTSKLSIASRLLGLVTFPLIFYAIIATQSRGGLLGILTIMGVIIYRRVPSKTLFFGAAGVAAILLYAVAGISERASGGAHEEGVDASAMGRIYAWQAAFGMALDNPLTGVGLDNFYVNYYFYSPHWDGLNHAVHSTWFGVLAETGFLGLIIFIAFVTSAMLSAKSTLEKVEAHVNELPISFYCSAQALLGGLAATIVSGTFLTQGFNWPIYLLSGLVIALTRATDEFLAKPK
ncbi:MAG: O-antigen ligase family protein [Shewanella sp.]